MKIRAITAGLKIAGTVQEAQFQQISKFLRAAKNEFEKNQITVQTLRVTTQPWENWAENMDKKSAIENFKKLEELKNIHGIHLFNIGPVSEAKNVNILADFFKIGENGFATANLIQDGQFNEEMAIEVSKLIIKISKYSNDGFTGKRFASLFNVKPDGPFFPGSFHSIDKEEPAFGIATENSLCLKQAIQGFKKSEEDSQIDIYSEIREKLQNEYKKIEEISFYLSENEKVEFNGIDVSLAPSAHRNESMINSLNKLPGMGKFGEAGSLYVVKKLTDILKSLEVKKCGYNGVMLPILEDLGLAKACDQNLITLQQLMLYSTACGTGLDTVPLPGNISPNNLKRILMDVATISLIQNSKPLSARLMPIPMTLYGGRTRIKDPYFVNANILNP